MQGEIKLFAATIAAIGSLLEAQLLQYMAWRSTACISLTPWQTVVYGVD